MLLLIHILICGLVLHSCSSLPQYYHNQERKITINAPAHTISKVVAVPPPTDDDDKEEDDEDEEDMTPYRFSYTAGRYPGHADRQHFEEKLTDGRTVGGYQYIDPFRRVQKVQYVVNKDGIVVDVGDAAHPMDTHAVASARERHFWMKKKIAADYEAIADQHRRLAETLGKLKKEDEDEE